MEQLIGIIIFAIIAAIGQWLQKRASGQETEQETDWDPMPRKTHPSRVPPQPPGRPIRWEEELRKQENERTIGRPIILHPPQLPQPTPPSRTPPRIPRETSEGDLVFKSPLQTAAQTKARVAALQARTADRMEIHGNRDLLHPVKKPPQANKAGNVEIRRALNLTKSTAGMREAFIASVVLGAPKSLADAAAQPTP